MNPLISFESVSVHYGNIQALKEVSLSVNEGEICSLIGANGAGKTTLLKALSGIEPLSGGAVLFENKILSSVEAGHTIPAHKRVAQGIALVPEGRHVFADMTVEENLDMGAYLVKNRALCIQRKKEMYELFPVLGVRRHQKSGQLSGGEQQMLAIARALMSGPRVLLLDEPGLGLAPLIIRHIFEIIREINIRQKVTVFLVEQNARMALQASNRAYVLETGTVVLEGSGRELLEDSRVRQAYLGE
jgi:branched-chain amino acid transport system ATP-binding protein